MIDIKFLRDNPDLVKAAAQHKNVTVDIDQIIALDQQRRQLQQQCDQLNQQRKQKTKPTPEAIEAGKQLKVQIGLLEEQSTQVESQLQALLYEVPNIPTADTPIGPDESGNQIVKEWGTKPVFDFTPKPHWELGVELDLIDNERAAKVSGARFTYLKGDLALMQQALTQFVFSVVVAKGFKPIVPPIFIKPAVFEKMARLHPTDERYYIPSDDLYLIGSAEHTLGPIHMDETIPEAKLPLRYVAISPAMRREAGAAGRDTRGILRLHQFDKVEMESFSTPDQALAEHALFVSIEEEILQKLNLPYQLLLKCTGDIGTPNARGMDINTWMPGQDTYRETHTADYMSDYQARRLHTKFKRTDGSTDFVHMNDATAAAIGRMLVAIMENYQTSTGSIVVPEVLRPWMFGITEIVKP